MRRTREVYADAAEETVEAALEAMLRREQVAGEDDAIFFFLFFLISPLLSRLGDSYLLKHVPRNPLFIGDIGSYFVYEPPRILCG